VGERYLAEILVDEDHLGKATKTVPEPWPARIPGLNPIEHKYSNHF
jgi:hypothetical protein